MSTRRVDTSAVTSADARIRAAHFPAGFAVPARLVFGVRGPRRRVLVLTTFEPVEYVHRALRAGASGFVLKDVPPEQLVVAVRTVADGGALLAPTVTRRLIRQFAAQRAVDPGLAGRLAELTARARDVVVAVAAGRSNAEIAGELFIGPAIVKSHVSSVLTKLGLRDRAQIVVVAYEGGLVTPGT